MFSAPPAAAALNFRTNAISDSPAGGAVLKLIDSSRLKPLRLL
jgi:hypothetical protein